MAYNKVLFPDKTVAIDLTNDTVDKNKLAIGATAHDRYGNIIVGNAIIGTRPDDLQESKEVAPTVEEQTITPDYTYVGLKQVIVKAIPTINTTFTENKRYTPINGFFNEIIVAVNPKLEDKIVNPSLEPQTVTAGSGYDGLGTVTINAVKLLQNKIVNPTTETQYVTLEDNDTENLGLKQVTVNPINIDSNNEFTENGRFPAEEGHFFNEVKVNVQPNLEDKTVSPLEEIQTITASEGYDGLKEVTISAIQTETATITENGTFTPTKGSYFNNVTVDVEQGVFPDGTLEITENDTYDVTEYESVNVNVEQGVFPTGTKSITSNGIFNVKEFEEVDVNVETEQEISLENKTITENGIYNPSEGYIGFNEVTVEVNFLLQTKTVSDNGTVTPDSGYDGLSKVIVSIAPYDGEYTEVTD